MSAEQVVVLPPLADGHDRVLWPGLLELAEQLTQPYVLIGGQMVHLHGAAAGRTSPRVTADVDLLFDVRAEVRALRAAVRVAYGDRTAPVYVPGLPHSVINKCRAFLRDHPRPAASTRSRHLEDVAFLVSLIADPDQAGIRPPDILAVLDDPAHYAWRRLGEFAEDGHLVWRQLRHGGG